MASAEGRADLATPALVYAAHRNPRAHRHGGFRVPDIGGAAPSLIAAFGHQTVRVVRAYGAPSDGIVVRARTSERYVKRTCR